MTILYHKSGKLMMTVACYKSGNDDESDNNKDKVCLLLKR